jgi:hypothetical protein
VRPLAVLIVAGAAAIAFAPVPRRSGKQLPPGVVELHSEMVVDTDLRGDPAGTVLRMAPDFVGRAAIVVRGGNAHLRDFTIEGNRDTRELRAGLPPYDVPFARFTAGNGILAEGVAGLTVERVKLRSIAGFAVLVSRSSHVTIDRVEVRDSGSRDVAGHNNTTGGILLEEGTTDFRVTNCDVRNVLGNGVWTHSLYTSPRNAHGDFADNAFDTIGRDALQVGHAFDVRVDGNSGRAIGQPKDVVDATPVAIDTAGNVERSSYARNRFEDINGKCIDLDGFHDGEVRANVCGKVGGYGIVMNNTNPDMQSRNIRVVDNRLETTLYGGIFVIGTGHVVARNRLFNINTAHCNENAAQAGCYYAAGEPDMLQSGIYLGRRAERPAPAHGNTVEDNEIVGFKMRERCVKSAPGVGPNVVRENICRDQSSIFP